MRCDFRALLLWVHRLFPAIDDVVIDPVFDMRRCVGCAEEALRVRLVFREQQCRSAIAAEESVTELRLSHLDDCLRRADGSLFQRRTIGRVVPRPAIAEPQRRQQVQFGCLRTAVVNADADENVFGRGLCVFHEQIEVAVLVEDARVEQFVLESAAATSAVSFDKVSVGKRRLRVLVEVLHVRMRRRAVEVEVVLFDIFAVIALTVGQPIQAFLKNRVAAVPQRHRKTDPLQIVRDAGQAIFPPAVCTPAGMVMGEVVPRVTPFAVVLADRSPLSLAKVGPPLLPGGFLLAIFSQSDLFGGHRHSTVGLSGPEGG